MAKKKLNHKLKKTVVSQCVTEEKKCPIQEDNASQAESKKSAQGSQKGKRKSVRRQPCDGGLRVTRAKTKHLKLGITDQVSDLNMMSGADVIDNANVLGGVNCSMGVDQDLEDNNKGDDDIQGEVEEDIQYYDGEYDNIDYPSELSQAIYPNDIADYDHFEEELDNEHNDYDINEEYPVEESQPASVDLPKDCEAVSSPRKANLASLPSAYSKLAERSSAITISPCFDNSQVQVLRKLESPPTSMAAVNYASLSTRQDITVSKTPSLNLKGVTVTKSIKKPTLDSQPPSTISNMEPEPDCESSPASFKKPKIRRNVSPKSEGGEVRTYSLTLFDDSHSEIQATVTEKLVKPSKRGRQKKQLIAELPIEGQMTFTTNLPSEIQAAISEKLVKPPKRPRKRKSLVPELPIEDSPSEIQAAISEKFVKPPKRPRQRKSLVPELPIEDSPSEIQAAISEKLVKPPKRPRQRKNLVAELPIEDFLPAQQGVTHLQCTPQLPQYVFESKELNITRRPYDDIPPQIATISPSEAQPAPKKTRKPKNEPRKTSIKKPSKKVAASKMKCQTDISTDLKSQPQLVEPELTGSSFLEEKSNQDINMKKPSQKQIPGDSKKGSGVIMDPNALGGKLSESESEKCKDVLNQESLSHNLKKLSQKQQTPIAEGVSSLKSLKGNIPLKNKPEVEALSQHLLKKIQPFKPPERVGDVCISPVVQDSTISRMKNSILSSTDQRTDAPIVSNQFTLKPFACNLQNNSQIAITRKTKNEGGMEFSSLTKVPSIGSPKQTPPSPHHASKETKHEHTGAVNTDVSLPSPTSIPSNEPLTKALSSNFDKKALDSTLQKPSSPPLALFQGSKSISFHKITPASKGATGTASEKSQTHEKPPPVSITPIIKPGSVIKKPQEVVSSSSHQTNKNEKHELLITRISKTPTTSHDGFGKEQVDQSVRVMEQNSSNLPSSIVSLHSSDEETEFPGFDMEFYLPLYNLRNFHYKKLLEDISMEYHIAPNKEDSDDTCSIASGFMTDVSSSSEEFCEVSPVKLSEIKRSGFGRDASRRQLNFTPHRERTPSKHSRRLLKMSKSTLRERVASKSVNINVLQEKYNEVSIMRKNGTSHGDDFSGGDQADYESYESDSGDLSLLSHDRLKGDPNGTPNVKSQMNLSSSLKDYKTISSKFQNSTEVTLTCKSPRKHPGEEDKVAVKVYKLKMYSSKSLLSNLNTRKSEGSELLGTFQFEDRKHFVFANPQSSLKCKYVISGSKLSQSQLEVVHKFVKMFHVGWTSDFDESVTHLVWGGSFPTRRYLRAIANKSYIVSMDWVSQCIKRRTLLHPMSYLVKGRGPLSCFLNHRRPLFSCYSAWLSPEISPDYQEFIEDVFTKLGGHIMELPIEEGQYGTIKFFLFCNEKDVTEEMAMELYKYEIWPLNCSWVTDCVNSFRIVNAQQYLHHSFSTEGPAYHYSKCNEDSLDHEDFGDSDPYRIEQRMDADDENEYVGHNSSDVIVLDSD